ALVGAINSAAPTPTMICGAKTATTDRLVILRAAIQNAPTAMRSAPPQRTTRGLARSSKRAVTGACTTMTPLAARNGTARRIGLRCWITPRRKLVAYAKPRKENMPTTATTDTAAKSRLRKSPSWSNGDYTLDSANRKSTRNTAAVTNAVTTRGEDQPSLGPWITP